MSYILVLGIGWQKVAGKSGPCGNGGKRTMEKSIQVVRDHNSVTVPSFHKKATRAQGPVSQRYDLD